MIAILTGLKWNLNVVLDYISLMSKMLLNIFFTYLLSTYTFLGVQYMFYLFAYLLIGLFDFWVLRCFSCLYNLDINLCSKNNWQRFSVTLWAIYSLFILSFAAQKHFNLILSHSLISVIISYAIGVLFSMPLPVHIVSNVSAMFSFVSKF